MPRRTSILLAGLLVTGLVAAGPAQAAPPANDNYANAQGITGASGIVHANNFEATVQTGEPEHADVPGGASVWYTWQAPNDPGQRYQFETYHSDLDTVLAIYSNAPDVGSLLGVVSNADETFNGNSAVWFTPTPDSIYKIAVAGEMESGLPDQGFFSLQWAPVPDNDQLADAEVLASTAAGSVPGTVTGASKGPPPEPQNGYDVWYTWTAPADGSYTFYTSGADSLAPFMTAYTDATLTSTYSGGFGSIEGSDHRYLQFFFSSGQVMYLRLFVSFPLESDFDLNWVGPPANDQIEDALVLPPTTSGTVGGSNVGATRRTFDTCPASGFPVIEEYEGTSARSSVWYEWTAPSTGRMVFDTLGSDIDTVLAIFSLADPSCERDVTFEVSNNDISDANNKSRVVLDATMGTVYKIAVDGRNGSGGDEGDLTLNWSPPVGNDAFADAVDLGSEVSGTRSSSNVGANKESGEPSHANNVGGASVWFKWTAPSDIAVEFDTDGSEFDTLLAVYRSSPGLGGFHDLGLVAGNDDHGVPTSRLGFDALSGTTYYIAVDGRVKSPQDNSGITAQVGDLTLNWNNSPANDDFAQAETIVGESGDVTRSNVGATRESGEPDHNFDGDASIWFNWVAPRSGRAVVEVSGTGFPATLGIWEGSTLAGLVPPSNLEEIFVANGGGFAFDIVEGTTYRIAADSRQFTPFLTGDITMTWRILDTTPPTVTVPALPTFQKRKTFTVNWSASDPSEPLTFDVHRGVSPKGSALVAPQLLLDNTSDTNLRVTGITGTTYCYQISSTDSLGNESALSPRRCTSVPLNNTELARKGRWAQKKGTGYFLNTYSESKKAGSALKSPRVKVKRISVIVTKCSGCGVVKVYFNGRLLKKLNLSAPSTRKRQFLAVKTFSSLKTGVVEVRVASRGKPVRVEGLGIGKV